MINCWLKATATGHLRIPKRGVYVVRVHGGSEDAELPDVMLALPLLPRAERDIELSGHRDDCANAITAELREGKNIGHTLGEGCPRCVDAYISIRFLTHCIAIGLPLG